MNSQCPNLAADWLQTLDPEDLGRASRKDGWLSARHVQVLCLFMSGYVSLAGFLAVCISVLCPLICQYMSPLKLPGTSDRKMLAPGSAIHRARVAPLHARHRRGGNGAPTYGLVDRQTNSIWKKATSSESFCTIDEIFFQM